MKLIFKCTTEDFIKYNRKLSRSKIINFSVWLNCALLGFLIFVAVFFKVPPVGYVIVLGLTAFCYIITHAHCSHDFTRKMDSYIRKAGAEYFEKDHSIELHENAIELNLAFREIKIPFSEIQSVTEDEDYIHLTFNPSDKAYIPIEHIYNIEDKDAFILELKAKIPPLQNSRTISKRAQR